MYSQLYAGFPLFHDVNAKFNKAAHIYDLFNPKINRKYYCLKIIFEYSVYRVFIHTFHEEDHDEDQETVRSIIHCYGVVANIDFDSIRPTHISPIYD